MGTKMAVAFANLLMAEIEAESSRKHGNVNRQDIDLFISKLTHAKMESHPKSATAEKIYRTAPIISYKKRKINTLVRAKL